MDQEGKSCTDKTRKWSCAPHDSYWELVVTILKGPLSAVSFLPWMKAGCILTCFRCVRSSPQNSVTVLGAQRRNWTRSSFKVVNAQANNAESLRHLGNNPVKFVCPTHKPCCKFSNFLWRHNIKLEENYNSFRGSQHYNKPELSSRSTRYKPSQSLPSTRREQWQ